MTSLCHLTHKSVTHVLSSARLKHPQEMRDDRVDPLTETTTQDDNNRPLATALTAVGQHDTTFTDQSIYYYKRDPYVSSPSSQTLFPLALTKMDSPLLNAHSREPRTETTSERQS